MAKDDVLVRDILAAYDIFKKYTQEPEVSELSITLQSGSVVGLPPIEEDPALKIVSGGKDQKKNERGKMIN